MGPGELALRFCLQGGTCRNLPCCGHCLPVTSLKDGMNLVCKEYCACKGKEPGVLILSEFAGAALQLAKGAVLVNPYDTDGVAEAIYRAFSMAEKEKRDRMRFLRKSIARQNVFWWVDNFLRAAAGKKPGNSPNRLYHPCGRV